MQRRSLAWRLAESVEQGSENPPCHSVEPLVTFSDSPLETHGRSDPAGEFGEHLGLGGKEIHVLTVAEFSIQVVAVKPGDHKASNLAADGGSQRVADPDHVPCEFQALAAQALGNKVIRVELQLLARTDEENASDERPHQLWGSGSKPDIVEESTNRRANDLDTAILEQAGG